MSALFRVICGTSYSQLIKLKGNEFKACYTKLSKHGLLSRNRYVSIYSIGISDKQCHSFILLGGVCAPTPIILILLRVQ